MNPSRWERCDRSFQRRPIDFDRCGAVVSYAEYGWLLTYWGQNGAERRQGSCYRSVCSLAPVGCIVHAPMCFYFAFQPSQALSQDLEDFEAEEDKVNPEVALAILTLLNSFGFYGSFSNCDCSFLAFAPIISSCLMSIYDLGKAPIAGRDLWPALLTILVISGLYVYFNRRREYLVV